MRDVGDSWMRAMDTRLVSTVEAVAGARCHESRGLLQRYYFAAHLCGKVPDIKRDAAREELHESEAALRRFVYECRRPELALA